MSFACLFVTVLEGVGSFVAALCAARAVLRIAGCDSRVAEFGARVAACGVGGDYVRGGVDYESFRDGGDEAGEAGQTELCVWLMK